KVLDGVPTFGFPRKPRALLAVRTRPSSARRRSALGKTRATGLVAHHLVLLACLDAATLVEAVEDRELLAGQAEFDHSRRKARGGVGGRSGDNMEPQRLHLR